MTTAIFLSYHMLEISFSISSLSMCVFKASVSILEAASNWILGIFKNHSYLLMERLMYLYLK